MDRTLLLQRACQAQLEFKFKIQESVFAVLGALAGQAGGLKASAFFCISQGCGQTVSIQTTKGKLCCGCVVISASLFTGTSAS